MRVADRSHHLFSRPGRGERTALFTRFRRACPGSERTIDGYIELPIMPPFPRESPLAIPGEMGASGGR